MSERTGGVPLFVEEVTRLLLERGEQGGVQAIPPTLQQSLAARLDRLGPAREVAQIGAVLGRDFAYALLRDVAEADEPALASIIGSACRRRPPVRRGRSTEARLSLQARADPGRGLREPAQEPPPGATSPRSRGVARRRTPSPKRSPIISPKPVSTISPSNGGARRATQALRRSAFQEAIAHLGKAIAMADKAGATARQATGGSAAPSRRLTQLHVAYGNALTAARGPGAAETSEAFVRAHQSAPGDEDVPERLAADYGLWVGSYVRGELSSMRVQAAAFLADVEGRPNSPEAGVAHRVQGTTHWFAGEFVEARDHLQRALALFQPGHDDDLAFRFGHDAGVGAMGLLAFALWPLGEVDRAVLHIERMRARIASLTNANTLAFGTMFTALFAMMRDDRSRARRSVSELTRIVCEHDLPLFRAFDLFLEGWATADAGAPADGLESMRCGVESLRAQSFLIFDGLVKIALAKTEAESRDLDRALSILDEALATSDRTGYRTFEAELHRARGEILLKHDPANPAPSEEAFLTAIAVAKQQGTRSFELRAALSLAKMYQSTVRPADAHAVLAPALEGFSPTPEMPELTEAQALLAALAEMEEVKSAEGQRQRRLHLQTAYGQAVMWSKGFAAEETKAAFARAAEFAAKSDDFSERFAAAHGQWTLAQERGELRKARELASNFLREAESEGHVMEVSVAHRSLAFMSFLAGGFLDARIHCEQALATCSLERDREAQEQTGEDTGTVAISMLALTSWHLGEVDRARGLIEAANRRAAEINHVLSMAIPHYLKCLLEIVRGDASAALIASKSLDALSREHGMALLQKSGQIVFELGEWTSP